MVHWGWFALSISNNDGKEFSMLSKSRQYFSLFLCGDVMTGRGVDQILPHPSRPLIHEPYIHDARNYVEIAEQTSGPIPKNVSPDYIWGDALKEWERREPDLKIINLETSVTKNDNHWVSKGINYRMHPKNIDILIGAGIDICSLCNNHILDWGAPGLTETLQTLTASQIKFAGAGETQEQAMAPAVAPLPLGGRLLLFSIGFESSGIPFEWMAKAQRPGVFLLESLNEKTVCKLIQHIEKFKGREDYVILSIHWGSNWVKKIPEGHKIFAHNLIDSQSVDLIHGHSSHHPCAIEIYKHKPIFYSCGDLINDYEGISGYEEFRGDLSLLYFLDLDLGKSTFNKIEMIPMKIQKFKLNYASDKDCRWIFHRLSRLSMDFDTVVRLKYNRLVI